jgi:hypothetical protein
MCRVVAVEVVAMYSMWGAVEVDASLRDLMRDVKKYPVRQLADALRFVTCHMQTSFTDV